MINYPPEDLEREVERLKTLDQAPGGGSGTVVLGQDLVFGGAVGRQFAGFEAWPWRSVAMP